MIVRTYARRSRDNGRSFSDPALLESGDPEGPDSQDFPLSQDGSQDRFNFAAAFSSQDSSPWSLDPIDLADHDPGPLPAKRRGGKKSSRNSLTAAPPSVAPTSTLMEAQEFGEMMEHVDEVNFALDGLRQGQPARIRRSSLLSLLSICGTAQQRRLLRAQGMSKRIVDSILGLNLEDLPSTLAAATLFFVLASDVQDDHLLDSAPCIHFLLKLLSPPMADAVEGRTLTIGSKLLGIRKPKVLSAANKGIDSSSRIIISKVQEILLSCKEIKSRGGDDKEMSRPELSSKWISLLTMEKACLSTVSFDDTSESVRKGKGNFKERLRELGGLDAIFDVVVSCHSSMERWLKCRSPSVSELKDGVILESVVLLLKCLKILENAMFLSKDNQDHLLCMRRKINSEGPSMSFVKVVISCIKFLSGLALLQSLSHICDKGKSMCLTENADTNLNHTSVLVKENKRGKEGSTLAGNVACGGIEGLKERNVTCNKRQKLSASASELADCGSEMTGGLGSDIYSFKNKARCSGSNLFHGTLRGSNGGTCIDTKVLNMNIDANGLEMNASKNSLKVNSDNSGKHERGWISIRATSSKTADSVRQSKRPHVSEDVEDGHPTDSYDPFAFDEGEFEPSKWEKLARKTESSQTPQSTVTNKELAKGHDDASIDTDPMLSESTNGDGHKSCEDNCPSVVQEDSNLLEDCLLASVKVLMNLTNDNPIGCHQIAECGGLDTMVSLIINHFPSYDLNSYMRGRPMEDTASSTQTSVGHLNNKHLTDHGLDFLVAILGLLVNLVEKDSQNRSRLASARVLVEGPGTSEVQRIYRDAIPLLCSIFLANQGAGEAAEEGRLLLSDDEALMQGEQEAEMMIIEAYAALLLAFLSTESADVREAIASCLPNHNLQALVPVLERFVAFHLQLNMISPETYSTVEKVIESCRGL